jgi:hypothetical protein
MNIQTKLLLSGQAAPFVGDSEDIAVFRQCYFTAYSDGTGSLSLQYKSPFFEDDWVNFYTFNFSESGYADGAFLDTPMESVRAISSGDGSFWAAFTAQN